MTASNQNKLLLSSWGLPPAVLEQLASKGLTKLYPWQAACLDCGAAGNNLVYCAPTSGGKSLVAEILMLGRMHSMQQAVAKQRRLTRRKFQQPLPRGLLVLPYLSIVSEKTQHMSKLLADIRWRVQGYQGDTEGQPLTNKAERIAICSIEKANMAINHMIQEGRLHELVSVVVDEAHMLADPHRGAALEMLLSKLMACQDRCNVQIVAMSATMAGLDSLSLWLDAHLFLTNFRPVPLTEHAVFEGTVYVKQAQAGARGTVAADPDTVLVESRRLPNVGKDDKLSLLALVSEVVNEGHSVLIFCASRHAAQSCAAMLTKELAAYGNKPSQVQRTAREELVDQLRLALVGTINKELENMIAAGVAYHHAGLMQQERTVVECGYRSGALLVLTATSTLAAGVNLPARRVILRSLWQGVGEVSRAQYLQMVGRAGRAGQSAVGESFLLGKGPAGAPHSRFCEWISVCKLLAAPLPVLRSQVVDLQALAASASPPQQQAVPANSGGSNKSSLSMQQQSQRLSSTPQDGPAAVQPMLQHLLLHGVATGLVSTGLSVAQLLQNTLAFHQMAAGDLQSAAKAALGGLRARKLISLKPDTPTKPSQWELTPLGQAVVASTMPPDLGLLLHNRLEVLMRDRVVLGTNAHLLYVLLPDPLFSINDWNQWQRLAEDMTAQHRLIAATERIDVAYIQRRCGGMLGEAAADARHARFAAAMLLDLVVRDASCVLEVENAWGKRDSLTKMGITRGQLQAWQLEVSRTAAMAALLASNAGWWQLETLLAPLAAQAAAGVRPELLPLMQVSGVQPAHALALYAAGFVSPDLLVSASESNVAAALAAKLPNMRKRKNSDKSGLDSQPGRSALVSRAAKAILAAARQHAVQSATAAGDLQGPMNGDDKVEPSSLQQQQYQLKQVHGQATVHQVFPRQDDPLLNQLLDAWQLQPSFSFAVLVDRQHCAHDCWLSSSQATAGSPAASHTVTIGSRNTPMAAAATAAAVDGSPCCALHCQRPVAISLCWMDKDVAVLRLPTSEAAKTAVHSRVWGTIRSVFGDAERTAICCGAAAAVATLTAAGVTCRVTIEDPCDAFLLWQPAACEQLAQEEQQQQAQQGVEPVSQLVLAMKAAHRMVLGAAHKLQIPIGSSPAQTEATRAALLAKALMPPLRALLAKHQHWQLYEDVKRPLQLIMASVRSNGLLVALTAVEEQRQQCQQHRQILQQHVQHVAGGLDISSPAQVRMFLARCRLAPAGSEFKESPLQHLLLKAVRTAIRQNQQPLLKLLQAICTYCQCDVYEQHLGLLLQHTIDTGSGGSASKHVLLQPLPSAGAGAGQLLQGYPGQLGSALKHVAVAGLPVAVADISLEDEGFIAVSSAVPVVMLLPVQSQQPQQYQEVSGVLHSVTLQSSSDQGSQLPLHGSLETGAPSYTGHVRYWCSTTNSAREQQLPSSAIHGISGSKQLLQQQKSWSLVSGTLSLASNVQASKADHMLVGVQLQQLPLVVLAALSKDPALLDAINQSDPLAAAAQLWLQHGGLPSATIGLLLRHVGAGAADGVPVPPSDVERVLFTLAMDALLLGQKSSVQRDLLALEQNGISLAASLLQAFPGLSHWKQQVLDQCSKHGYLQSLQGRKIAFNLPAEGSGLSSKESRALSDAQRMACSLAAMASVHDAECVTAAVVHRYCVGNGIINSFVACGDRQIVLEVPAASPLSFLRSAVPAIHAEVVAMLGLRQVCRVHRFPLKWWWGSNLDLLRVNWFSV